MSVAYFWTLPVEADARGRAGGGGANFPQGLRDERRDRFTIYDYLFQVARAAEAAGFSGAFIPWNERGEDPWIVAATLARDVRRLVFLPELQPAFATPVYLAKMSASFQRFSGNRLAWKLDLERDPAVRRAHGDYLEGADWFARASEYLQAARGVWTREPFDFEGTFLGVQAGGLKGPLAGLPLPPVYTSGRSDAALVFAAEHADVHFLDGGSLYDVRRQLERLDRASAAAPRVLGRGVRLAVAPREAEADEALARRIDELVALGIDHVVLEGAPALEEAYRIGEHVFPKLSARARPAARLAGATPLPAVRTAGATATAATTLPSA